jgi:Spy/CpxP family protein refolding chaperone
MTRRVLGAVAAVSLFASGLVYAQQRGPGMRRGNMAGRMARFLDLTDAQKEQLRQIREQTRTEAEPFAKQIRAAHQEVAAMVKSGAAPEAVQKRAEELAAANAPAVQKLAGIHARAAAARFAVLTPEQREKAKDLRDSFGPGLGRMGPGI